MDCVYLDQRKKEISQAIKDFIKREKLKNMRMLIDDPNNEFLRMITNPWEKEFYYQETYFYVTAYFGQFDYKKDNSFNEADGLIVFEQKGSSSKNDILYYEGIYLNKKTFFVVLETISKQGIYESDSFDICFNPFENDMKII